MCKEKRDLGNDVFCWFCLWFRLFVFVRLIDGEFYIKKFENNEFIVK